MLPQWLTPSLQFARRLDSSDAMECGFSRIEHREQDSLLWSNDECSAGLEPDKRTAVPTSATIGMLPGLVVTVCSAPEAWVW